MLPLALAARAVASAASTRVPELQPHVVVMGEVALPHLTSVSASAAATCSALAASPTSDVAGAISMNGLEHLYGIDQLHRAGDLGAGSSIAVVEFAPFLPHDVAIFRTCLGATTRLTRLVVNGGPSTRNRTNRMGELESELDIETLSALAPAAHLIVVDARERSYGDILDAYRAAIASGANVVVTTWGSCEASITGAFQSDEANLFAQAAAEGITVVAASGDDGSQDCPTNRVASEGLSVDDPASQPEVTGVGGVTINAGTTESAWNDGPGQAGGGGISSTFAMPTYQLSAAAAQRLLTPATPCAETGCREIPDVSADAGTPVAIACNVPTMCHGIALTGGTSLAAPIWASVFALADASSSCEGHPVGFANPVLYAIAAGRHARGAFVDITTGNNDPLRVASPRYRAHRGFDLASGLGAPKVAGRFGLVAQLCSYAAAA